MFEAQHFHRDLDQLNEYFERDIREREEHGNLVRDFQRWYMEDSVEHDDNYEE